MKPLQRKDDDESEDSSNLRGGVRSEEEVAGNARSDAETRIGKSIVSDDNYLQLSEKKKKRLKE